MKIKNNLLCLLGLILITVLTSCAHHKDVRPGIEGVHKIRIEAENPEQGTRNAIEQGQHFCEKRNKDAAFIKENKKYTGDMDEKSYKTAKKVSKIAQVVGGSVWVFGQRKGTKSLGGLVGLGGTAADIAIGKGYTVEMRFKCI